MRAVRCILNILAICKCKYHPPCILTVLFSNTLCKFLVFHFDFYLFIGALKFCPTGKT